MNDKVSGHYIFDGMIPAKTVAVKLEAGTAQMKYLYSGNGEWEWYNNPEAWDYNAVEAPKKEWDALIAKVDGNKKK